MRRQRRNMVIVRGLVVAAVLAAAAAQAREGKMLRFGIDVKGTQVQVVPSDADDPKPLRFGSPSMRVEGRLLLAELVVENTAERPLRIVVNPYGGTFIVLLREYLQKYPDSFLVPVARFCLAELAFDAYAPEEALTSLDELDELIARGTDFSWLAT